jgi:hypothetical protein
MKVELEELRDDRKKLSEFIYDSPEYDNLERCEQVNLVMQYSAVCNYEHILAKRIFWEATKE